MNPLWIHSWVTTLLHQHSFHQPWRLSPHLSQSLHLHHIILWHHKLLPHLAAFPFLLPGFDLSRIERPLVQMVFLLLLLQKESEKRSHGVLDGNAFSIRPMFSKRWQSCFLFICMSMFMALTLCLRFSFMMSLVSCSIFSFHRSKK